MMNNGVRRGQPHVDDHEEQVEISNAVQITEQSSRYAWIF